MNDELRVIHAYFSHHIRNCAAMIAASVTLLSYRMTSDEQKLIDEVTEASFLLDLFDAGMNICFDHTFGLPHIDYNDDYDIEAFVRHFLDQCKTIISERDVELDFRVNNPSVVKGNSHELRIIINLIIYEMILQAIRSASIELNKNRIIVSADAYRTAPPIWGVIKNVLKIRGISFSFDDKECVLEFTV